MFGVLATIGIFAVLLLGGWALDEQACYARWRGSQFPVQWSIMGGCKIEIDRQWIPEDNYREIPK